MLLAETWNNEVEDLGPPRERNVKFRFWILAAAVVAAFITGLFLFRPMLNIEDQKQQTLSAGNEYRHFQLPDGSVVWLSPNSQLKLKDRFNQQARNVDLDGEAFFEVSHQLNKPFIIRTGEVRTTVLGTSFNVEAYPAKKQIEVTLLRGKVAVYSGLQKKQEEMTPGQQVTVNTLTGGFRKRDFPDAADYLNRRSGIFKYQGQTLSEVARDLETRYGIQISVQPEISGRMFYGQLHLNTPVDEVLNTLCTVTEVKPEKQKNGYRLVGKTETGP